MKKIIASTRFLKFKNHSPSQLQLEIDQQVKLIAKDPDIGELKKGDLKGIRVYKFKFKAQQYLLSYEVLNNILFLYLIGRHENYYKGILKNYHFI